MNSKINKQKDENRLRKLHRRNDLIEIQRYTEYLKDQQIVVEETPRTIESNYDDYILFEKLSKTIQKLNYHFQFWENLKFRVTVEIVDFNDRGELEKLMKECPSIGEDWKDDE